MNTRLFTWALLPAVFCSLAMQSVSVCQTLSDADRLVDSLFIMSSSTLIQDQEKVEPSKKALAEMGTAAVPRMIAKLSSEDARERQAIVDIFKRIGSSAVPALSQALNTDNLYALRNAERCLGEIGDRSAVPALLPLLDNSDYSVREAAVTSIGQCRDSTSLLRCLALFHDSVDVVRKSAVVAAGRIADSRAIDELIGALDDPHFSVRMTAVASLSGIGRPPCDSLLARFSELDEMSRSLAFDVWATCRYKPATSVIEGATHSPDPLARGFAIKALAAVNPKTALSRIKKMKQIEGDLFVLSQIDIAEKIALAPKH